MKNALLLAILAGVFLPSTLLAQLPCSCTKAKENERTEWGNNPTAAVLPGTCTEIEGVVSDSSGDPLESALVELYDNPEAGAFFKKGDKPPKGAQKRVAACRLGPDGDFCFKKLAEGDYELRASLKGYDCAVFLVRIRPGEKAAPSPVEIFLAPALDGVDAETKDE